MKAFSFLVSLTLLSLLLVLQATPVQAMDMTGKWALGLHVGNYKLGLTDHSDIWTVGWLGNAELKYGLSPKWTIGAEWNYMQTYLADLKTGDEREKGAGFTADRIPGGPRQRDYVAGLLLQCHFMPDAGWSPFLSFGTGMYIWNWTDKNWDNLVSWDPALSSTEIPSSDKAGDYYHLKDQELYAMVGGGLEFFPTNWLSFEFGGKFRYLTRAFTNFTGDQDIVGTGTGELDLPKVVSEVYVGLSLLFGGPESKPLPFESQASANPTSGSPFLTVQFEGFASGGRPPYAYSWDFGDGGTSNQQNPSHTYQASGSYAPVLIVTDSKGNSFRSETAPIAVACPPLTCTASVEPTSGMAPLTVDFSASASGGCPPYGYSWDLGEIGSSNEQNPSYSIEKEGDYTARLTVTDSKGNACEKTVSFATAAEYIPTPEKPLVLKGVNFATGKAVLIGDSEQILDRVAASLIEHPDVRVEVAGHCDSQGSEAYNLQLSSLRANAVRKYLISKGVADDRLVAKGYGETQPIADNSTAEGRAENRRVELTRIF